MYFLVIGSCAVMVSVEIMCDPRSTIKGVLKSFPFCVWRAVHRALPLKRGVRCYIRTAIFIPFIFGTEVVLAAFLSIVYFPLKAVRWMLDV